jgi:hypothetical protein
MRRVRNRAGGRDVPPGVPRDEEPAVRRTVTVLTLSTALLGAVVLGRTDGGGSMPPGGGPVVGDGILAAGSGLTAAADCDQLLAHLQREAIARMTPWGLPGTGYGWLMGGVAEETAVAGDAGADAAAPADGARASTTDTTNTQEVGVDEPDIVETDGTHLYVGTNGALTVLDVSGATPREVGRLAIPDAGDLPMMRVGDRLVVFTPRWSERPLPGQPSRWRTLPGTSRRTASPRGCRTGAAPRSPASPSSTSPTRPVRAWSRPSTWTVAS